MLACVIISVRRCDEAFEGMKSVGRCDASVGMCDHQSFGWCDEMLIGVMKVLASLII